MALESSREGFPPDWTTEAIATLEQDGRQYVVRTWYPVIRDSDEGDGGIWYHWNDGNYACDDNRSFMIRAQCDPEFPEHDCGDTIKLVDLKIVRHPILPTIA